MYIVGISQFMIFGLKDIETGKDNMLSSWSVEWSELLELQGLTFSEVTMELI